MTQTKIHNLGDILRMHALNYRLLPYLHLNHFSLLFAFIDLDKSEQYRKEDRHNE